MMEKWFSMTRYPTIRIHALAALRCVWCPLSESALGNATPAAAAVTSGPSHGQQGPHRTRLNCSVACVLDKGK